MRIHSNVTLHVKSEAFSSAAETVIVISIRRTVCIYVVNELRKHNFSACSFCALLEYFLYGKLVSNFAKKNHQVVTSLLFHATS